MLLKETQILFYFRFLSELECIWDADVMLTSSVCDVITKFATDKFNCYEKYIVNKGMQGQTMEKLWELYRNDDVIKWKHFPRYWPFVREIHRSPVNSPHKGQWRGALMFSLIRVWINGWVNNRKAGDMRRYRGHYDVIVMRYALDHKVHTRR